MAVDQDSDLAFERRYRLVQHIGWGLMALFLLLALTGVFGTLLGHLIVRALVIYLGVLVLFRIAGRRTMAQITPFDLVLLLIISEAVQPALLGDTSLLEAFVLVTTLVGADILLGELSQRSRRIERLVDGTGCGRRITARHRDPKGDPPSGEAGTPPQPQAPVLAGHLEQIDPLVHPARPGHERDRRRAHQSGRARVAVMSWAIPADSSRRSTPTRPAARSSSSSSSGGGR